MTTIDFSDPEPKHRVLQAVLAWTAVILVLTLVLRTQLGLPLEAALPSSIVNYVTLALVVWPVWVIGGRLAANRSVSAWNRRLLHVAMGLAALTVWAAVQLAYSRLAVGPNFWAYVFASTWMFQIFTTATTYTAAVAIGLSLQAADRERIRERHEAALELATREAELIALKAQLRPHFLLNALTSVLALIDEDTPQARVMVERLADLLRAVFERLELHEVTLAREADMVRAYLDVERIRFGPRLTYEVDIPASAGDVPVPSFLLQPIVENAVKHGIEPHLRPGAVRLAATLEAGRLVITVRDTGNGFEEGAATGGRGLELTRRRLDELYGSNYRLAFGRQENTFTVRLELPALASHAA